MFFLEDIVWDQATDEAVLHGMTSLWSLTKYVLGGGAYTAAELVIDRTPDTLSSVHVCHSRRGKCVFQKLDC